MNQLFYSANVTSEAFLKMPVYDGTLRQISIGIGRFRHLREFPLKISTEFRENKEKHLHCVSSVPYITPF